MLIRIIIISICFFNFKVVLCQNLIPNPSFETIIDCPDSESGLNFVENWFNPTNGTPDVFNRCHVMGFEGDYTCPIDTGEYDLDLWEWAVPINILGCQHPKTGDGYTGIILYRNVEWREYLQVELIEELTSGTKYYLQIHVSIADLSHNSTDALQFAFVSDSVLFNTDYVIDYNFNLEVGFLLEENQEWLELNFEYIADGGERFLVIGNFKEDDEIETGILNPHKDTFNGTYVYIDDVYLGEVPITSITEQKGWDNNVQLLYNSNDKTIHINNLPTGSHEVMIYNTQAEVVTSGFTTNGKIDVSNLSTGVYIIRLNMNGTYDTIRFMMP